MKKILLLFFGAICTCTTLVYGQVLRPMTVRYNNPSVKGNIVYVSNNIITSQGIATNEAPPGGTAVNNGHTGANIDIDAPPSVTYISFGSNWKYLANNTRPANWQTTGFADGGWPSGNGQLGYGDGDEATCVPSGGGGTLCLPTGTKYITTYFRKTINIPDPSSHNNFILNVLRDDGVAIYVNGVEVYRNNLPAGALAHATLASAAAPDDGNTIQTATIATSFFVPGNNVIAVEMHQNVATSTDLTFDMELIGAPVLYTTFVPFGANWKYLANNTRPSGWETSGFADGAWPAGNAELGYGDADEATCIPSGGGGTLCLPTGTKYITSYFRHTVNIANPSSYYNFVLNLIRDDGAVVYVNGTEVVRSNMPAGALSHATLAASNVGGAAESTIYSYTIASSYFVNGLNTIAVEVHQDDATSSDLSFNFELKGSLDSTFNSSSADLNLPSCSNVLFAGLYWGATQGNDGTNTSWIVNETAVKLKLPGAANFVDLISTQTDYHNDVLVPGLPHTGYRCFRDITSLINTTNPNGTYTIANVCSPAGIINTAGGWTIVIAYSDPGTIGRNLTVYDGSVIMNGGDPALHVPITGFLTPPSGPVSCELGAVVFDGDRVSVDEFSFKQNSNPLVGTYTNLTPNATANLNDMWNGTISYKGSVVTTRVPAHQNTLGYDADIIDVPNALNAVLGNSQSSASIRFSSPSENYMIQVATTAISQYTPVFRVSKSAVDLDGGSLDPGDSIRYRVDYINGGNDASTATTIIDNIPASTTYAPNSLIIGGVAKTDAMGDDEAEYDFVNNRVVFRLGTGANGTTGGEISPGSSGYVTFKVYTPSSCAAATCNSTLSNRARMTYGGKLSLLNLVDSSGVDISGCTVPNPVVNLITGSCSSLQDTILTNTCPSLQVMLPVARYGGYSFHTGMPFSGGTRYNPANPVTFTRVIYAFYDGPGSCDDTIRINIYISGCPDIDDDNDGIPDYVELNNPVALADADGDGIPNWSDPTPGGAIVWVDNNIDGSNDWFDPAADADNDGILNFYDTDFPGYVDTNGDAVNDNMDKDLDGIPNNFDLDSDNDGIPDTVESFGVDADGDGRIDNYSDTDGDGLSQNVDASGPGANFIYGSGLGLGALDTDSDGLPNYLDLDSDNDGIPDITEAYGTDASNSARINIYTDADGDGYTDALDADVGNDNIAENSGSALLRTGVDGNNDGRCDSWPNKNMDSDSKPNPYDLDSDGDGITDVREAQFTDANWDGRVDGPVNNNGRNTALAGLPALSIPNTDATGRINPYDIDSDDDGIPDNVEGMSTLSYLLPSGNDTDNDGIDNTYDNFNGFGGDGIHPVNTDGDLLPDYLDSDTDGDGLIDRIEGNDLNLNYLPDDNVTLTGIDTDGDGLDDRFDNLNSSHKGTSARMGNGGSTTGDPVPGSITTVQRSPASDGVACTFERDWRCIPYVLSCEIITFKAVLFNNITQLEWKVLCRQEADYFEIERSIDGNNFQSIKQVTGRLILNEIETYNTADNVSGVNANIIYYRLKTVLRSGRSSYSNIVTVKPGGMYSSVQLYPNPANNFVRVTIGSTSSEKIQLQILDAAGKMVMRFNDFLQPGNNTFSFNLNSLSEGLYYLRLETNLESRILKFNILK